MCQLARDFLTEHKNADVIVYDPQTNLPVKAVYYGPDSTGNHRSQPAEFYFSDFFC